MVGFMKIEGFDNSASSTCCVLKFPNNALKNSNLSLLTISLVDIDWRIY